MDREKVIKGLQEIVDDNWMKTHADWYVSVCADTLALLKEQEDLGTELTNAVELIHKKNERIEKLLKEQKEKTGKWIEQTDYMGDTYYDCSVCNESWITIEGTPWVNGMNYCPHCGAKMEFEGR